MRGELVALDLETTGLDPENDTIIEVGAVRIKDGIITAEYSSLVNPDRPIPASITHLTGISNEDVIGAPTIAQVLPAIRTFAGNLPVIGHNIGFDLAFLYRQGILQNNLRVDTYDLASVVLPRTPRYNLGSLVLQFGINLSHAHRALDDARAAALLYWKLWEKVLALPYPTLYEIHMASQGLNWDARHVFEAAVNESRAAGAPALPTAETAAAFQSALEESAPLRASTITAKLDTAALSTLMSADNVLAERLSSYEERHQQIEMAQAVAQAFNQQQHLMVEAGTGTGKSLAYLLPAMLWANENHQRVVISTNTINLQEQLIQKDIPALQAALNLPLKASVLKGRSNYLCPRRLAALRRRRPTQIDELRTLAKILVWLLEGGSGDKGEISLRGPVENNIWLRLSAEDEGCTLDRCQAVMGGACPFYKARKAAESAHLLIVNHALLLSDTTSDTGGVLPNYRYVIVDEAHHLEEAATNSLTFRVDEATLQRRLADLGGPAKGLLGDLLSSMRSYIPDKQLSRMEAFVQNISAATGAMGIHIRALFNDLQGFVTSATNGNRANDYNLQFRVVPQHRAQPAFVQCQRSWMTLKEFFEVISQAMRRLNEGLARLAEYNIPNYADLVSGTNAAARHLDEIHAQITAFTLEPDSNAIYWVSGGQNGSNLAINSAPLHVGSLLEQHLWSKKDTVILTSATLRTNGSFDYMRERLHAEHAETLELGSPFDYATSTLLYIPNDMPEPNDQQNYQQAFERGLIELAAALNGRTMVLFTSYSHLQQTKQNIAARLALGNIAVYDQAEGSSRQALLDGFKAADRAVLLGTKSFWEGVDVPGEALSALVIARLPFAVPTDPIFAARSETYQDGFKSYAVPDAVLRFRQGFGRLIRSRTDRGIVVIFDRRVVSKSYGVSFLEALPDCTKQSGTLRALPETAKAWMERGAVESR